MSSGFTYPAAHPPQFYIKTISNVDLITTLWSDYRLSQGSDFTMHANHDFANASPKDLTGVIGHVLCLARLRNSGVTSIRVTSHSVEVIFSAATTPEHRLNLLRQAVHRAGLGTATVK